MGTIPSMPPAAETMGTGERFYRNLVEASTDLIWAVDLQGRFT